MRPKTRTIEGNAFELKKCIPIDMFPYTNHCEAVFVLDRL